MAEIAIDANVIVGHPYAADAQHDRAEQKTTSYCNSTNRSGLGPKRRAIHASHRVVEFAIARSPREHPRRPQQGTRTLRSS
jgi:hypothetical protein